MMVLKKHKLTIIALFLFLLVAACASAPEISVEGLPQYEALFSNQRGWTGADGAYSIALSGDHILWLFGDTWFGEIRDGAHVDAVIVNNSIAIQHGLKLPDISVEFYIGRGPGGTPQAFILPADDTGWFWIYHGVETPAGLYLFLIQLERTGTIQDFGFKVIGTWLGHVVDTERDPADWHITQVRIPYENLSESADTILGSSVLKDGEFLYIYGTTEKVIDGLRSKNMILARVPEKDFADFDKWRFFAEGQWISDFSKAAGICDRMANEYSVSFLPALGKYLVVYSDNGLSENIVARSAPQPWGPWGDPVILYQCPEMKRDAQVFCYAAKGHPALATAPDELIVTYVTNSIGFDKITEDAELYRPRFLKVRFQK
jgi:hypothetical protein